ncbi:hypothetical protein HN709_03950 [Candidatus Peregrinibacteria bacterium]|jgi:hypothetical protein|nr:hypothetical protein [Candidatus Peregrinibacteria bacterium]MBT7736817.1 hypothetical protein [Candidatus Peregrinibacteria bacterium]
MAEERFEYLDVENVPDVDDNLDVRTMDTSSGALQRLEQMYYLSHLFDGVDGFKATNIVPLKKYLDQVQGFPGRFGYPRQDIAMAASQALRIGAFDDAQNGIIWPVQARVPHKTYYSHPWEHKTPWNQATSYPAIYPNGVTLYYGYPEDVPERSLQRLYGVGAENVRYKIEDVPPESFVDGLKVLKNVFEVKRNENRFVLDYYFEHRDELKAFVRERINPDRIYELWNVQLDLSKKIGDDLAHRSVQNPFSEHFTFPVDHGICLNVRDGLSFENDVSPIETLSPSEREMLMQKILNFALIDLAFSEDELGITQEHIGGMYCDAEFRDCYNHYASYLGRFKHFVDGECAETGFERRIYGYEAYMLIIHSILFESDDIMHHFRSEPHYADVDIARGGERFIFIEDIVQKVRAMGIDLMHVEDVTVDLYQYFQSLGLTLIRRSGSREITQEAVDSGRRLNDFFGGRRPIYKEREIVRMQILAQLEYVDESKIRRRAS